MIEFFTKTGKLSLGSRLRLLTDTITLDDVRIYQLYGIDLKPKWFPVFFVLAHEGAKTITAIAREIRHSHPSVSYIVKEMAAKGLIKEVADLTDKRKNQVALSEQGERVAEEMQVLCADVEAAAEQISRQAHSDLWKAIGEWEELLTQKSLLQRVQEAKQKREAEGISIVPFAPRHQAVFQQLNEAWIQTHWQLEANDLKTLNHPQEYILDKGGHIFVALYRNRPVGVCALCKWPGPEYDFELAKLAVNPQVQRMGIGSRLCRTAINKAGELGARRITLISNTLLQTAIQLYKKLGFRELPECRSDYERGNIQMELVLP